MLFKQQNITTHLEVREFNFFRKEVSKEEDSKDAYSDLLSGNADIAKASSATFMDLPNTLFNDTSMGSGGMKEVLMKKRNVDDTDSKDDNHDALLEATEMEIADFVIKGNLFIAIAKVYLSYLSKYTCLIFFLLS